MSFNGKRKWWRMTTLLAWGATAIAILLAAGAILFLNRPGAFTVLAMPAGVFVGLIAVPAGLTALVFVHAARQEASDRKAGLYDY